LLHPADKRPSATFKAILAKVLRYIEQKHTNLSSVNRMSFDTRAVPNHHANTHQTCSYAPNGQTSQAANKNK
jgi:hypothetical protein